MNFQNLHLKTIVSQGDVFYLTDKKADYMNWSKQFCTSFEKDFFIHELQKRIYDL